LANQAIRATKRLISSKSRAARVTSAPTRAPANVAIVVTTPGVAQDDEVAGDASPQRMLDDVLVSRVVKPQLLKAESAWNFARSHGIPVSSKATAPTRTQMKEARITVRSRTTTQTSSRE
jgi:hypothetical protein